jgi:4-hydroxybenzoate polyprenyltransferase
LNLASVGVRETLKAYVDLTRAHFAICWPLLFCSGLLLAFENYSGFTRSLLFRASLLGLFGLEAGMVLNDYVDRDLDSKDVDFEHLTSYWRPFKQRPIPSGLISPRQALGLFLLLVALCLVLVATLPYPHSLYLLAIMAASYLLQTFYQVKKRSQKLPIAQLLGRVDITLFPIAGYLCHGHPDETVLALFLFFYPWILAHLAVNDLVDVENDRARGMRSVTVLYGLSGTARWILAFTLLHLLAAPLLLVQLGPPAWIGFLPGFLLLGVANYVIMRDKSPRAGMKALPLFHLTMAIYVIAIILDYAL